MKTKSKNEKKKKTRWFRDGSMRKRKERQGEINK